MVFTYPVLQVLHRADHLVFFQGWGYLMRMKVILTVGGQTLQAGLQGLELRSCADVTGHFSRLGRGLNSVSDWYPLAKFHNLSEGSVDFELRSFVKCLLTHWTLALFSGIPVPDDAGRSCVHMEW